MIKSYDIQIYKCPVCETDLLFENKKFLYCKNFKCIKNITPFYFFNNKPVLVNFEVSVIDENSFINIKGASSVKRTQSKYLVILRNFFRKKNHIVAQNSEFLVNNLERIENPSILVIGGGEIGNGMGDVYNKFKSNIISLDIYDTDNVDIIADAHMIPFKDNYFDFVIIQAVLEHVINPQRVVSEIWRVLKVDGIVYAETPFMQQVHEGPYDFTRFSDSGHRYLFKKFECLKSGYLLGVGTSLVWSINYFFSGLFRSRLIGKIFGLSFFWLSFFDKYIPDSFNIDGASGVYFIGKKGNISINSKELIKYYKGFQV